MCFSYGVFVLQSQNRARVTSFYKTFRTLFQELCLVVLCTSGSFTGSFQTTKPSQTLIFSLFFICFFLMGRFHVPLLFLFYFTSVFSILLNEKLISLENKLIYTVNFVRLLGFLFVGCQT